MGLLLEEEVDSTEIFHYGGYFNTFSRKEMVDGGNGNLEGEYSFLSVKLQEVGVYQIKNTDQNQLSLFFPRDCKEVG